MRKILVAAAIMLGMLVAMVFMAAAPSQAATGPSNARCAAASTYTHPHSRVFKRCERKGFFYNIGSYVETDGHVVHWVIVVGPRGHIYVDSQGWITR